MNKMVPGLVVSTASEEVPRKGEFKADTLELGGAEIPVPVNYATGKNG